MNPIAIPLALLFMIPLGLFFVAVLLELCAWLSRHIPDFQIVETKWGAWGSGIGAGSCKRRGRWLWVRYEHQSCILYFSGDLTLQLPAFYEARERWGY
jgi:hypothetical protein